MSSSSTNKAPLENLSMIVAADIEGNIGKDNNLPWSSLQGDLPRFKYLTRNSALIMGRKTFESLPGLLPGRMHIVISSNYRTLRKLHADNTQVQFCSSIDRALVLVMSQPHESFTVVGGSRLYSRMFNYVKLLYVTRVHAIVGADVAVDELRYNAVALRKFALIAESKTCTSRELLPFSFMTYLNRRSVSNTPLKRYLLSLRIKLIDRKFYKET